MVSYNCQTNEHNELNAPFTDERSQFAVVRKYSDAGCAGGFVCFLDMNGDMIYDAHVHVGYFFRMPSSGCQGVMKR